MKNIKLVMLSFLMYSILGFSQSKQHLEAINQDIWKNFTKAYENLDSTLFRSLHEESLVRIGANSKSIKDLDTYIKGYERRWENKAISQTISFRFIERISDNERASERGIYKLTVNPNSDDEANYYGKFHVILVKKSVTWKILVDYDSNEANTINENSYKNAFAIDDFVKY